jgi:hypothetical protein
MKRIFAGLLCVIAGPALANTCTALQAGATDQSVYLSFIDESTGVPTAALAYNEAGIDLEYVRSGAAAVDITEATQTANGAHSDGGFISVGHGRYRLDLPDAAVAAGVPQVTVQGVITGYILLPCAVALSPAATVTLSGVAGAHYPLGIIDAGTLQSISGTTAELQEVQSWEDDAAYGATIVLTSGACAGAYASISDFVASTDIATVANWTGCASPSGTPTYVIFPTVPQAGITAAFIRTALGFATASYDTDIAGIATDVDTSLTQIAAVPAAIRDLDVEDQDTGRSLGCTLAALLAYAAGDLATTGSDSTYEDPSGTETRITGTVASAGNRTASVTCPSY